MSQTVTPSNQIQITEEAVMISESDHKIVQELLQKPELTGIYRNVLKRVNNENIDYIKLKLMELVGTLDTLDIYRSYTKPPKDNP